MTVRRLWLVPALALLLSLSVDARAQGRRLVVQVVPPKDAGPMGQMLTMQVTGHLTKADLEVLAAAPGKVEPALVPTNVEVHYRVQAREDGTIGARLWAVEVVTGERIAEAEAKAGAKRRKDTRAMAAAIDKAAPKLLAGLSAYRERLVQEGWPMMIELRDGPAGLADKLKVLLESHSTQLQAGPPSPTVATWLLRTKSDCLDLGKAMLQLAEKTSPKAGCEVQTQTGKTIILACKG